MAILDNYKSFLTYETIHTRPYAVVFYKIRKSSGHTGINYCLPSVCFIHFNTDVYMEVIPCNVMIKIVFIYFYFFYVF